jgi:hypothetical protein
MQIRRTTHASECLRALFGDFLTPWIEAQKLKTVS